MAESMEDIGYDAFAAGPGAASAGPAEDWTPDGPDLSTARKQVFVEDRHKRPSNTSSTGAEPPPAAAPPHTMVSPGAARGAGFGIIWAAAGAGIGASVGGWWGAGAGLLLAGAIRNGARARRLWGSENPADREEAATSATMAVIGGGAGAYLGYRAYNRDNEAE